MKDNIPCQIIRSHVAHYLVGEEIRRTVDCLVSQISNSLEFDYLVFTGLSGALTAIPLAERIGKDLIVVRKNIEDSHYCQKIEVPNTFIRKDFTYLIVDELVDSGDTIRKIIKEINKYAKRLKIKAKCKGAIFNENSYLSTNSSLIVESANSTIRNKKLNF